MAPSHTDVPPAALCAELQRLCEAGQTGHLIAMTSHKRSAMFTLCQGDIVSVSYAMKTGLEALDLLRQEDVGSPTFIALPRKSAPPPSALSTAEILQHLGGAPARPAAAAAAAAPGALSSRDQAILETALAHYVGPIAQLICRQVLETASDFDTAVAGLMQEIPDMRQAAAFATAARAARSKTA